MKNSISVRTGKGLGLMKRPPEKKTILVQSQQIPLNSPSELKGTVKIVPLLDHLKD